MLNMVKHLFRYVIINRESVIIRNGFFAVAQNDKKKEPNEKPA
jgi:hypothetical protein